MNWTPHPPSRSSAKSSTPSPAAKLQVMMAFHLTSSRLGRRLFILTTSTNSCFSVRMKDQFHRTCVTPTAQRCIKTKETAVTAISLLSIVGKVFARVVLDRLQSLAERIYPEAECCVRAGRSTVDMIFSLRQLQEKCREQRKPLYLTFTDLTKAFDLVSRTSSCFCEGSDATQALENDSLHPRRYKRHCLV